MKIINKWQLIHMNLGTTLTNIHLTLLNGYIPQISTLDIPKYTIPFDGVVFTRQVMIQRSKLKLSKGNDISISMFHHLLENTNIEDDVLPPLVRLLLKLRKEGY